MPSFELIPVSPILLASGCLYPLGSLLSTFDGDSGSLTLR